jgi:hypothetical protein
LQPTAQSKGLESHVNYVLGVTLQNIVYRAVPGSNLGQDIAYFVLFSWGFSTHQANVMAKFWLYHDHYLSK